MQKKKSFKYLEEKSNSSKSIKEILVNYLNKKIINN